MKQIEIEKIDSFIARKPVSEDGIVWYLPQEKPFRMGGFAWSEGARSFERIPEAKFPQTVTQFPNGVPTVISKTKCGAYALRLHTAGGQVQFRSDSRRILLDGELLDAGGMDHMAFTGSGGFDLYVREDDGDNNNEWKCLGVSRFDHDGKHFRCQLHAGALEKKMRSFLIHFPLYNGIRSLAIGLEANAGVEVPLPWRSPRPIVWYGTSIAQGGCASRPGMAASNEISRMWDQEVLNLGFSGSGRGEPEIADLLSQIADPALYIVDYDWNIVSAEEMSATLPGVLNQLRRNHMDTPILVVSQTPSGEQAVAMQSAQKEIILKKRDIQQQEVWNRQDKGDHNIYFVDGQLLLGEDWWETLVDGCHLTDLGFYRFSRNLLPFMKKALK